MNDQEFQAGKGKDKVTLVVDMPISEEIDQADRCYASKMAGLIRENKKNKLLMRSQLDDFLKENDIWSEKDQEKVLDLQKNVDNLLNILRKGGIKLSEGRKFAIKVTDRRLEMLTLLAKRRQFDETTMESLAETDRNDYLIYLCTRNVATKERYWLSFEDMKDDKYGLVYKQASDKLFRMTYGIDADVDKTLPENMWLKKYGFIDQDLRFTDRKTGKHVDKDGHEVDDETSLEDIGNNFYGEIEEQAPFIDDDTGEVVVLKSVKKKKTRKAKK